MLIHNGRILEANLRRERITLEELRAALRRNGVLDPANVRVAVLEENGAISVIRRDPGAEPPHRGGEGADPRGEG